MASDIVGTVASAITIGSTICFVYKCSGWIKEIDNLPQRLSVNLRRLENLRFLINQSERFIDNVSRPPCLQIDGLLDCLRRCRAVKKSASQYIEHAKKHISHPTRYVQVVNCCRILWGGGLGNIESELTSHIHALIEATAQGGNPSIKSDGLDVEEGKQPYLNPFPVTVHNAFEERVIDHIPIDADPSTQKRPQRWEVLTHTIHPCWWPSRGFKFGYHRSASGNIRPSLRPYTIQAPGSEIFYAVSGGDLNQTLKLFSSGDSSPFVRDNAGCSLLHYASCSNNLLLCKRLIESGLKDTVDEETPQGMTAGHLALLSALRDQSKDRTFINHLISMFIPFSEDPNSYAISPKVFLIGCCAAAPDVGKLGSFQKIVAPRFFEEPKTNLLRTAKIYTLASQPSRHPRPEVLKFLLGLGKADHVSELLESASGRGGLLHVLAVSLTRYHRGSRPTFAGSPSKAEFEEDANRWKDLCCNLIRTATEDELHHVETFKLDNIMKGYSRTRPTKWNGSSLYSVLQALFLDDFAAPKSQRGSTYTQAQRWYETLSSTVRVWLQHLLTAGVDLDHYGWRESMLLNAQRRADIGCLDFTLWSSAWSPRHRAFIETSLPVRLADFKFGSLTQEWVFYWEVDVEKLVGEFWHAVDAQTSYPQPPGAWVN